MINWLICRTEPFIAYTVEVTASTMIGEGESYSMIVFTEHGGIRLNCNTEPHVIDYHHAVPIVPTLSSVIRLSESSMKVFWIPLTPDEARGVLTQLQIAYQAAVNGSCSSIGEDEMQLMTIEEEVDTQSEAVVDGLVAGEEYCVAIQVSTSAGESGFSNILMAQRKLLDNNNY